mmetsp:Transcript_81788/g.237143  ORF Transcript_81788/g.237143 Transcript_81788/m.237143 type:complete len:85 (+) Transcript_81788:630-884(+)
MPNRRYNTRYIQSLLICNTLCLTKVDQPKTAIVKAKQISSVWITIKNAELEHLVSLDIHEQVNILLNFAIQEEKLHLVSHSKAF